MERCRLCPCTPGLLSPGIWGDRLCWTFLSVVWSSGPSAASRQGEEHSRKREITEHIRPFNWLRPALQLHLSFGIWTQMSKEFYRNIPKGAGALDPGLCGPEWVWVGIHWFKHPPIEQACTEWNCFLFFFLVILNLSIINHSTDRDVYFPVRHRAGSLVSLDLVGI